MVRVLTLVATLVLSLTYHCAYASDGESDVALHRDPIWGAPLSAVIAIASLYGICVLCALVCGHYEHESALATLASRLVRNVRRPLGAFIEFVCLLLPLGIYCWIADRKRRQHS